MNTMQIKGFRHSYSIGRFYIQARKERNARHRQWARHQTFLLFLTALISFGLLQLPMSTPNSQEHTIDRVEGGQWVVASMYWEDKLVSNGKKFNPIGWYIAHKTLPIGTHVRITNPKNKRSINVTVGDRGPFVPGRDIDLTLGAGTLLDFQGLGPLYMEVISLEPGESKQPLIQNLFAAK